MEMTCLICLQNSSVHVELLEASRQTYRNRVKLAFVVEQGKQLIVARTVGIGL